MIGDIHRRFLEAGADIIETNTFSATSITQSEFFNEDPRETAAARIRHSIRRSSTTSSSGELAWEINFHPLARAARWADRVGEPTERKRYVAGAIGPLTVSLSISPDADDAGFRVVLSIR